MTAATQPLADDSPTQEIPHVRPAAPAPGRHRSHGDLAPPESRGELNTADRVVEKIAATALDEIAEIGGPARRVLGVAVGSDDAGHRPRVEATVHGTTVDLDVSATVTYPAPIARTADRARAHVSERVAALTTLQVRRVDITVTALATDPVQKGRGLR